MVSAVRVINIHKVRGRRSVLSLSDHTPPRPPLSLALACSLPLNLNRWAALQTCHLSEKAERGRETSHRGPSLAAAGSTGRAIFMRMQKRKSERVIPRRTRSGFLFLFPLFDPIISHMSNSC